MTVLLLKIKDLKDKKLIVLRDTAGAEIDHVKVPYTELYDIGALLNCIEQFPLNHEIKFNKIVIKRNQTTFGITVATTQSYVSVGASSMEEIPSNLPRTFSYEFDLFIGKFLSRKIMEYTVPEITVKPIPNPPPAENTASSVKQEN